MNNSPNALGEYLRARRGLVTPAQAGLVVHGTRRVPGLRREEVAMLAGLSADYYLRLERGRDRNPSTQVLESLARVLLLDDAHLQHLMGLVGERPRARTTRRAESVPPGIAALVSTLTQPAYVEGRWFDVLVSNPAAQALSPRFAVGGNQLRSLFLDPDEQALYPDWNGAAACLAANLRRSVGTDVDDPRFIELVGELSLASPEFSALWARHDVKVQSGGVMRFQHPVVGTLSLNRERLEVEGSSGLHLVIHHADAGSADEEKLALLVAAALPVHEAPAAREREDVE